MPYGTYSSRQPTTTHTVRATIQRSQASLVQLSRELGINPKTVAKWRKRATVEDMKTGPPQPRSLVLSEAEEAAILAFNLLFTALSEYEVDLGPRIEPIYLRDALNILLF